MKLSTLIDWRVFSGCLVASFLLAWGVQLLSGLSYWASWGIVTFAWIAVGISTFFDDDEPKGRQPLAHSIPFRGAYRIATIVAALHLLGVALTAWYVSTAEQSSGQAVMVWAFWSIIDLPVSLLGYFLFDGQYFLVHAVVGTLWWFFVITVITRIVQAWSGRMNATPSNNRIERSRER
jgi:hypothetical protein